jgi:hypothetical protein
VESSGNSTQRYVRRLAVYVVGRSRASLSGTGLHQEQWIYTFTEGKEAPHYAAIDGKGSVFKNYMKKNYNYSVTGGDHLELPRLLELL